MKVLNTIDDHLTRLELVCGDRVALVEEPDGQNGSGGELTYSRLVELVRAQAAGLDHLGVGRGERVAIVSRSSTRLLTSFLAVIGTGRVLVPIDVRMRGHDLVDVIDNSGATMLLMDPEFDSALFRGLTEQHFVLGTGTDAELYRFGVGAESWGSDDDEAIAVIEHAEGPTGRLELRSLTHRDLRVDLAAFGWQLDLSDRDVYLHTVPLCHSRSWGFLYALTAMGGRHICFGRVDGAEVLRRIDACGVTLIDGAPAPGMTMLGAAASWDGPLPGYDGLRVVLTGPPPPMIERLEAECGWTCVQVSGLAEPCPVQTRSERGTDEIPLPTTGLAVGG